MEEDGEYSWVATLGFFSAILMAMGIGANDFANSWGVVVGSRSAGLLFAITLGSALEMIGSLTIGAREGSTINKKVVDYQCFEEDPGVLMFGLGCALFSASTWLLLTCFAGMPCSTTHSILGGLIGMGICVSPNCVDWYTPYEAFPYMKGVSSLAVSTFLSPAIAIAGGAFCFTLVRGVIMRGDNSVRKVFWAYPCLIGVSLIVNVFYITTKAGSLLGIEEMPFSRTYSIAFGIGASAAVVSVPSVIPFLRQRVKLRASEHSFARPAGGVQKSKSDAHSTGGTNAAAGAKSILAFASRLPLVRTVVKNVTADCEAAGALDARVEAIYAKSEAFDFRTEEVFKYLQLFGACSLSYVHGAKDVSNAMGPLIGLYSIFQNGVVSKNSSLDGSGHEWGFFVAVSIGMAVGILLLGYKLNTLLGFELGKISPSRGFCVLLGGTLTIVIGTHLQLPLSTTHCIVGSLVGVLIAEGRHGLHWPKVLKVLVGWCLTIPITALFSAAIFSQAVYSPRISQSGDQIQESA